MPNWGRIECVLTLDLTEFNRGIEAARSTLMLTMTPQVVRSFDTSIDVRDLIQQYINKYGFRYGSAWGVELPRFIQSLVDGGEIDRARKCLDECYSSNISDEWWHEMARKHDHPID